MTSNSKQVNRCLICDRALRRIGEDFTGKQIYKCDACQYVCTPLPDAISSSALYDDPEYFEGWGSTPDFDYDRFEPDVGRQVEEYLDFIARHTNGKSLLDVGTGSGLLPHLALERGYEVEGTDLSKHVSDHVPAKGGFVVHHGKLEDLQLPRKYDIITLFHVLEHSDNPLTTIARCNELLNSRGHVVVVVPNYQSLDSRLKDIMSKMKLKKRPYKHLALGHHNWVFSLKSLELLGEKCGLQIVYRQTKQPASRANVWNRLLGRFGLASWCWIVYRRAV